MKYYAAVDIGGGSGRVMLFWLSEGKILGEEIHRFEHEIKEKDGLLTWDTEYLFGEILSGLRKCGESGRIPYSVAIDMWGVDYVLLDENGELTSPAVSNRDGRVDGMDGILAEKLSEEEMYSIAGIQKMTLNTVYQLVSVREQHPEWLEKAKTFLLLPDYMTYRLTGNIASEYTNASTTSLLDAKTRDWSDRIISAVGAKRSLFPKVVMPGTEAGHFLPEIREAVGYDSKVIYTASHDTGSAVVSVLDSDAIYISSGTWGLVGLELDEPNLSSEARAKNFTNEGGYGGKIRFLKNVVGMWFFQSVRRETDRKYSYPEMAEAARKWGTPSCRINVLEERFLAPKSMISEIRAATGCPEMTLPEILATVYHSLAECYAKIFSLCDEISGKNYEKVCIIGGGSRDTYLNELCALYSGRTVFRGVVEATATGNAAVQMIAAGEIKDLAEARSIIGRSI